MAMTTTEAGWRLYVLRRSICPARVLVKPLSGSRRAPPCSPVAAEPIQSRTHARPNLNPTPNQGTQTPLLRISRQLVSFRAARPLPTWLELNLYPHKYANLRITKAAPSAGHFFRPPLTSGRGKAKDPLGPSNVTSFQAIDATPAAWPVTQQRPATRPACSISARPPAPTLWPGRFRGET